MSATSSGAGSRSREATTRSSRACSTSGTKTTSVSSTSFGSMTVNCRSRSIANSVRVAGGIMNIRRNAARYFLLIACVLAGAATPRLAAQAPAGPVAGTVAAIGPASPSPVHQPATAYVIGPDDELSIVFWRDKDLSADVVVRPDGKISLPLIND